MSDDLKHNGRCLGWIHPYTGDGGAVDKFILEMNGIGELELLCRLSEEDILEIGDEKIAYDVFKTQIMSRVKRIYLSTREYVLDFHLQETQRR